MIILRSVLFSCLLFTSAQLQGEPPVDLEVVLPHQTRYERKTHTAPQPTIDPIIPLMHFSQEQLWEMHHEKEYDIVYNQHKCKDWSVDDFNHAAKITQNKTSKQWFFEQWELYKFRSYWQFLKSFPDYEDCLLNAYEKACKEYNNPSNWYFVDKNHLNFVAGECKGIKSRREVQEAQRKARLKYESSIKSGYQEHNHELDEQIDDYYDALELYDSINANSDRYDRRMQAMFVDEASLRFQEHVHYISDDVRQELLQRRIRPDEYEHCYGSALQQTIHQECIDIVERTVQLNSDHPAYAYKDALIDMADGARELNRLGNTEKAMSVTDVCWGILDCCSAVVEGAIEGAIGAVTDIYNNPLQTVASLTVGNYLMAYQALKIATNLADIALTSLVDAQAGREKWDDYIQPITNVITAISSAELSLATIRTGLKQGTRLFVQNRVQGKILGGLGKFYSTVKTQAVNYIEKNPLTTLQMYMTTPEGVMFKAVDESFYTAQRAAQSSQFVAGNTTQSNRSAWLSRKDIKAAAKAAEKKLKDAGKPSIKSLIKKAGLPWKGKLRFVPEKKFDVANGIPQGKSKRGDMGYKDRFGNIWVQGNTRTLGVRGFKYEPKEWDVQLSPQGVQKVGWMTRDNTHLNVSFQGRVTHK